MKFAIVALTLLTGTPALTLPKKADHADLNEISKRREELMYGILGFTDKVSEIDRVKYKFKYVLWADSSISDKVRDSAVVVWETTDSQPKTMALHFVYVDNAWHVIPVAYKP